MGTVAVQKQKLSGGSREGLVLETQVEFSSLNIHQEKAVIGIPVKGVAGLVDKMPALQRVKKHFLSRSAGGVYKIFGF